MGSDGHDRVFQNSYTNSMMRTNNAQLRVIKYTIFQLSVLLMHVCITSEMKIYFQRDQDSIMQKDSCQRKCICQYLTYIKLYLSYQEVYRLVSKYLYICITKMMSTYLSIHLSFYLSMILYIYIFYPYIHLSLYLSINL